MTNRIAEVMRLLHEATQAELDQLCNHHRAAFVQVLRDWQEIAQRPRGSQFPKKEDLQ